MVKHLFYTGIFGALIGMTAPAYAANCAKRDLVVDRLQGKYSEQLTAGGLQASRTSTSVLEVWSSPETGTFTVMVTNAHGVSCIVATGTDFFADTPELAPAGQAG